MKFKEIVNTAQKIITNVENKQSVGVAYENYTVLLANSILHIGKGVGKRPTGKAPSPAGTAINKDLKKKEYLKVAQYIIDFVKERGRIPNYVAFGKYHISPRLWIYCFSKIIVWYDKNGQLPNTCKFDNNVFYVNKGKKKYGHATKCGCDNMGQNNGYYCGCHSLQEVFRNLTGIVVSQDTIASWAGTTSAGTGHWGMDTAVAAFNRKYNKKLKVDWYNFSELGWSGIKKIVDSNNKDCIIHNLYRLSDGHYEVVNAVNDSNINVQNSLGYRSCNDCYCGYIEYRSKSEFEDYISGISQQSVMVITNG